MQQTYTLTIKCPDRVGLVAAVASFLADRQGWIIEANHHSDSTNNMFYMRQMILANSLSCSLEEFRSDFAVMADEFQLEWRVTDSARRNQVVVLVSKQDHCLSDLLHRYRGGEMDIPCVISNHETLRDYVEWHGGPFHHLPGTRETKAEAFAEIERLYNEAGGDVMVLARFMQILPADMCDRLFGQVINIHHSFLPSFVGAKPYHQAFERGVKLIGATCHYATAELDAGPIIEQDVVRVSHAHLASDMVHLGRDVERIVLARGLRYHLEDRVLIHGNKTVVLQ
jgi:formyltetrahydrofolate deformylase